ncbi:MAG: hypothetical protein OXI94_05335 [Gemmatimonadota bacterium]|nr:hypothetical protein [Gemmatimonadota bacterium]
MEKASTETGFENMEKYYGSIPEDKIDPDIKEMSKAIVEAEKRGEGPITVVV